jgi:hypothetical protein
VESAKVLGRFGRFDIHPFDQQHRQEMPENSKIYCACFYGYYILTRGECCHCGKYSWLGGDVYWALYAHP